MPISVAMRRTFGEVSANEMARWQVLYRADGLQAGLRHVLVEST